MTIGAKIWLWILLLSNVTGLFYLFSNDAEIILIIQMFLNIVAISLMLFLKNAGRLFSALHTGSRRPFFQSQIFVSTGRWTFSSDYHWIGTQNRHYMAMPEKQLAGNEIKNSHDRIPKSYITKNNERHASRATLMSTEISHSPDA